MILVCSFPWLEPEVSRNSHGFSRAPAAGRSVFGSQRVAVVFSATLAGRAFAFIDEGVSSTWSHEALRPASSLHLELSTSACGYLKLKL